MGSSIENSNLGQQWGLFFCQPQRLTLLSNARVFMIIALFSRYGKRMILKINFNLPGNIVHTNGVQSTCLQSRPCHIKRASVVTSNLDETTFFDTLFYLLKIILLVIELIQANKKGGQKKQFLRLLTGPLMRVGMANLILHRSCYSLQLY